MNTDEERTEMSMDVDSLNGLTEKAVREHHDLFTAQCLNYVKATGLPICLLLNFGSPRLDIKRYLHASFHA
jgi:GxxExxY protein